ncbi:MAG: hypothetical protein ABSD42_12255 [Candidatus Bathyarchaeia archaeon]
MRIPIAIKLDIKTGHPIQKCSSNVTSKNSTETSMHKITKALAIPLFETTRLFPFVSGNANPSKMIGKAMLNIMCTGSMPATQIQFTPK